MSRLAHAKPAPAPKLDAALNRISATAPERDAQPVPAFPEAAFVELERAGATTFSAVPGFERPAAAGELGLVREVEARRDRAGAAREPARAARRGRGRPRALDRSHEQI